LPAIQFVPWWHWKLEFGKQTEALPSWRKAEAAECLFLDQCWHSVTARWSQLVPRRLLGLSAVLPSRSLLLASPCESALVKHVSLENESCII
jgi:hypothetical protein